MKINIIGAGLAGVESAHFLANQGYDINLYEMRDKKMTPAHKTGFFAELVCSNSLKATAVENAHGLLKKEMENLDSIVVKTAYKHSVPAGGALAVDRDSFAEEITNKILNHQKITIIKDEITSLDSLIASEEPLIIATGPLTSDGLKDEIIKITGEESLFFFDAASPVVDASTLNYDKVFFQSRYDKGTPDYLNAPFTEEEYNNFVNEIINAEKAEFHDFESKKIFEGCQPIEVLAERGISTLAFGPMKPVGLRDPKTGKRPFAVVQLRTENINKSMYNLVGFQTRLKWNEQKRIFRMIPGLENAEFFRYGVMHKNTFINFPQIADKKTYAVKKYDNIFFAGQITGVEGYMESAASGIFTAYAVLGKLNNKKIIFPDDTMIGALQKYTLTENKNYQPMASNFGLITKDVFDEKGRKLRKRDKKKKLAELSIEIIKEFVKRYI